MVSEEVPVTFDSSTEVNTLYIVASLMCGACQGEKYERLRNPVRALIDKWIKACGCGMPFCPKAALIQEKATCCFA